jgi:hypothetical protein
MGESVSLNLLRRLGTLGLITACASPAFASPGIVGGTEVQPGDPIAATTVLIVGEIPAPSSAAFRKPKPAQPTGSNSNMEQYICTGSILADDIVVTAAHCVVADPANIRIVFATTIDNLQQSAVAPIDAYVANPKWKGDASKGIDQGDIALIHLTQPLPAGYHPATLLSQSDTLSPGEDTILAGYGITDAGTQNGAGTLRQTTVQVAGDLGNTEEILDQSHGTGACHGDSGGPAFVQADSGDLLLWGLTNRSYPDNAPDDCGHQVVYTRIDTYSTWISQVEDWLRAK